MLIVGKQAPEFLLEGVQAGEIKSFNSYQFLGKYVLYFFFPAAFSEVCPTELLALDENVHEFKKRHVNLLAISPDSVYALTEFQHTPRDQGGVAGISFPILSDIKKSMAREFGVLDKELGVPYRAVLIVNRDGEVVYGSVNNLFIGRNTDELVRLVDAFQYTETHRGFCPIDWRPGDDVIPEGPGASRQYYSKKFG